MAATAHFMLQFRLEDKKLLPNPFGRVVGDPLEDSIDVQEINREAFDACRRLIEDVKSQRGSGAITLFGDAGTGKTHLLGRVRRWLETTPESLFVAVRMDTSARMLWRHLRRSLADALLRADASGRRAIDRLLRARRNTVEHLPERDLAIVLENLVDGKHVRDSAAWLRGQELPETALDRMELAGPGPEENQEVASRNAVVSLCSLIEPGVVVFCLDQWEALQSFASDTEGLFASGQAVSFLHDPPLRNVCIICCVQSGFMPRLETVLDEAIRHRLLSRRQGIHPLDWDQARRLISARLDEVQALSEIRRGNGNLLWPLAEAPIRQVFTANAAPARRVISRCKDLFDLWRCGEEAPEKTLDAFLESMLEERIQRVDPADAEAAVRNGLPLLLHSMAAAPGAGGGAFDFSLRGGRQRIAVCNQANARSLLARLQKIDEAFRPGEGQSILLLRDARLPIGAKAEKTRQRLKSIEDKGGRLVAISQEAVEALAALRRLLADAQSGDLAYRGDPVPASSVEQWIAGHLPSSVESLVSALEVANPLSPRLADLVSQRKIVSVEEAARALEARSEEVESCARRDPRLFGFLGGGTPAVFQVVERVDSAATE